MPPKQSVYLKIVDDIKRKIDLGLIAENEQLPSCRELAMSLGINPNTVQRSYSLLEEDGYIYTLPKKGVYAKARDGEVKALDIAREKIVELKRAGLKKEQMLSIVAEVYGEDE